MKMGTVALVVSLIGLMAVIAVVAFMLYRPDPLAEARRSGDPTRVVRAEAVIESLQDTGSRQNQNAVLAFGLRYAGPGGRQFNIRIERAVPPLQLAQVAVGKRVALEYDALHPEKADLTEALTIVGS
jgi:hypothetical protein